MIIARPLYLVPAEFKDHLENELNENSQYKVCNYQTIVFRVPTGYVIYADYGDELVNFDQCISNLSFLYRASCFVDLDGKVIKNRYGNVDKKYQIN